MKPPTNKLSGRAYRLALVNLDGVFKIADEPLSL